MKIVSRYLFGTVLCLILAAGTVRAQFIKTIGGNPIVARANADSLSSIYLMDTNHPFTSTGSLNSWEIYAVNTNQVALVIFRQVGGKFMEVGRSQLKMPTMGYNRFYLGLKTRIRVQAGDFVGAYSPGQGAIAFSVDNATPSSGVGAECAYPGGLEKGVLVTNPNASSSITFLGSCDRHYSLRAFDIESTR